MRTTSTLLTAALVASCLVGVVHAQGEQTTALQNPCTALSPPRESVGKPLHAYMLHIHPLSTPRQFTGCIGAWIMAGSEPVLIYSTEYEAGQATKHTIHTFYGSRTPSTTVCNYKAGALVSLEASSASPPENCPPFSSLAVPGQ
jgi:hypothetical protein